ncbi:MAG TPA: hypothetical protein VI248_25530, partial [Kineosporiaceae bacterium]
MTDAGTTDAAATGATGRAGLSRDARLVLAAQALRAFAYGLGAVLLGRTLAALHASGTTVGAVLAGTVTGTAVASLAVARFGDRFGRRRSYRTLYLLLAATGAVFAVADRAWLLVAAGLAGAMSSEVIESGPFTSLEQAMLAGTLAGDAAGARVRHLQRRRRGERLAGSPGGVGAGAGASGLAGRTWRPTLVLGVRAGRVGRGGAVRTVEQRRRGPRAAAVPRPALLAPGSSRGPDPAARHVGARAITRARRAVGGTVRGGLLRRRDDGLGVRGLLAVGPVRRPRGDDRGHLGLLQAASFLVAPLIADRMGLLATMVSTHLASDVFLAAVAFAPSLPWAIGLLAARSSLSQMDVPTRQAYVMALVDPGERTAAAAY